MLSSYIVWKCDDGVSLWSGCCWLVDYEFGFVRRGLPGACLRSPDGVLPLVASVARLQLWSLVAAVVFSLYRVFRAARRAEPACVAQLPAWLALAHATGRWSVFGAVVRRHPRWFLAAILACLALGPIGVGNTMGSRFCLLRPMGS